MGIINNQQNGNVNRKNIYVVISKHVNLYNQNANYLIGHNFGHSLHTNHTQIRRALSLDPPNIP